MKYFIVTLGCQMNISDSERLKTVCEKSGLKSVPPAGGTDLVIINACSVRQAAVDRIFGRIKVWQKKSKPLIFLTGCILPADIKKLTPRVDWIFKINDLNKLAKKIQEITHLEKSWLCPKNYSKITPQYSKKDEVYIPIIYGCNNFCSYCAVPFTRGREKSRSEQEIIAEVKKAVKNGAKKIMLLGQNVNRYKLKNQKSKIKMTRKNSKLLNTKTPFVELLKKLIKIPGNFQLLFMSPNPWDFPAELIKLIATEPKISKQIHLPVQSGDDQILKRMNRPYTSKQYLDLVSNLRSQISGLKLSTDIIVGFPGETKKAFQNTPLLCRKAQFDKAYISQYSPRPDTAAARLKDDVSRLEKKRRWQILNTLINK